MLIYFFGTQSIPTALLTFLLQSTYNYGIIFMNANLFDASYVEVPGIEYRARTLACLQHSIDLGWTDLQQNFARFIQIWSAVIPFC
jgi:hypothetical protein